jgi:hypothetical protein
VEPAAPSAEETWTPPEAEPTTSGEPEGTSPDDGGSGEGPARAPDDPGTPDPVPDPADQGVPPGDLEPLPLPPPPPPESGTPAEELPPAPPEESGTPGEGESGLPPEETGTPDPSEPGPAAEPFVEAGALLEPGAIDQPQILPSAGIDELPVEPVEPALS